MFKKINKKIHLWLGLICFPIVFFICITGCILAFEDEIKEYTEPYNFVEYQSSPFINPSTLITEGKKHVPSPNSQVRVRIDYRGEKMSAILMAFNQEGMYNVYLNPYSGEFLHVKDLNKDFFRTIRSGHRNLWLGYPGRIIVGITTLIFTICLITGIALWFPSRYSNSNIKKRLIINTKSGAKRLIFDLHNTLGFYTFLFCLILSISGLIISFNWVSHSLYSVISLGATYPEGKTVYSDTTKMDMHGKGNPLDIIFNNVLSEYPTGKNTAISILPPYSQTSPIWIIINENAQNTIQTTESRYYREFRYFDQYTLCELKTGELENKSVYKDGIADKIIRANYDIHTGRIGSIVTKCIAFVISLIASSLPVTGFIIWRRKKS